MTDAQQTADADAGADAEVPVDPTEHRIVVGVDGSDASNEALDWAIRQAALTGAVLEIVKAWEWPTAYGFSPYYPTDFDPSADAKVVLSEAESRVHEAQPGITVRGVLVDENPAPALVERSRGADLLVVGSRGHGEFVGMLLGSVSQHCVNNAHCPVLVYRDGRD